MIRTRFCLTHISLGLFSIHSGVTVDVMHGKTKPGRPDDFLIKHTRNLLYIIILYIIVYWTRLRWKSPTLLADLCHALECRLCVCFMDLLVSHVFLRRVPGWDMPSSYLLLASSKSEQEHGQQVLSQTFVRSFYRLVCIQAAVHRNIPPCRICFGHQHWTSVPDISTWTSVPDISTWHEHSQCGLCAKFLFFLSFHAKCC